MAGLRAVYTIVPSVLGHLLVVVTARGVAAVRFGDDERALVAGVRRTHPGAVREDRHPALRRSTAALLAAIEKGARPTGVPLDVDGTPFERRVWAALAAIPTGETRSYGEVARRIGRRGAARAVARACAANPVAVLVPCHRVVPAAGGVGGYRWGAWRKAWLLARERAQGFSRRSRARLRALSVSR